MIGTGRRVSRSRGSLNRCSPARRVPELPEVETVRRGLERQLQGFRISRIAVLRARAVAWPPDPELFCQAMTGCEVGTWSRRGKYLIEIGRAHV